MLKNMVVEFFAFWMIAQMYTLSDISLKTMSFAVVCSAAVVELSLLLYLVSVLVSLHGNKYIAREGKRTFWSCYMPLNGNLGSLVSGISFNLIFDTEPCISFDNLSWFLNIQRFKGRKPESCESCSGGAYLTMTSLSISCAQIGRKKISKQGRGQTVTSIAGWSEIKFQTEIGWQLAKIAV